MRKSCFILIGMAFFLSGIPLLHADETGSGTLIQISGLAIFLLSSVGLIGKNVKKKLKKTGTDREGN